METRVSSLQGQISRANSYYQELCDFQDLLLQQCKAASQELIEVEKAINSLCGAIYSATKMSHVGAPQAIGAMQNSSGILRIVYELLQSGRSYTNISFRNGSASDKMIHFSPDIAAKHQRLAQLYQSIVALSSQTQQHESSLDSQQAADIAQYQAKAVQMAERISALGEFIAVFTDYIAEVERLYGEAQKNAIIRANHIPY